MSKKVIQTLDCMVSQAGISENCCWLLGVTRLRLVSFQNDKRNLLRRNEKETNFCGQANPKVREAFVELTKKIKIMLTGSNQNLVEFLIAEKERIILKVYKTLISSFLPSRRTTLRKKEINWSGSVPESNTTIVSLVDDRLPVKAATKENM